MRGAVSLILLASLAACDRDSGAAQQAQTALRPDADAADIPPPPPPPPPPPACAVMLAPGEARVFGACSVTEMEAALDAPAESDPRAPSCTVRAAAGAAAYAGCEDLSMAGLRLLERAAADYSPTDDLASPSEARPSEPAAAPGPSAGQP